MGYAEKIKEIHNASVEMYGKSIYVGAMFLGFVFGFIMGWLIM